MEGAGGGVDALREAITEEKNGKSDSNQPHKNKSPGREE